MLKRFLKSLLLYVIVIVTAILIPLFSNHSSLAKSIYNFISVANKDYYGVVLSALAILITFMIFNSQNEKERELRFEDEQRRNSREEKEYLENREKRFASARPYFIVEKNSTALKAKIKIFMEENVPLENILVCERKLSDEEAEVRTQIIGTRNSGDYIYEFSLKDLEMIIVRCTTYFDEDIYFQYYTGDITIHYRMVENKEDLNHGKNLGRTVLSDYLIDKNENNENYEPNDKKTEIYKQNIYSVAWEKVAKKRFSQYRFQLLNSIVADRIFTGNKNLAILGVIEKDSIGEILGGSITYLREHHKDFSRENIIELLGTIKKYLSDDWYTKCTELSEERRYYFKNNLPHTPLHKKYSALFDQSINAEVMMKYIDDLTSIAEADYFSDYLFRNLEVYLNEHVEIAGGKIDIEIVTLFDKIRTEIKQILSKTLS